MRHVLDEQQIHPAIREQISARNRDVVDEVRAAIDEHEVVVVGMAQNPYPGQARRALSAAGVPFHYLGYGSYLSQWRRRNALKMWTGWPTFPMVFVKGVLVGGAADVRRLIEAGELGARASLILLAALLVTGCAATGEDSDSEPAPPSPCATEQIELEGGLCVAESCGDQPFGGLAALDPVVWVAPWGADDAPGNREQPIRRLRDGLDLARGAGGGVVALDAGNYQENLQLAGIHAGIEIAGRCADLVSVDGSRDASPTLQYTGDGAFAISGLTLTGGTVGLWVERGFTGGAPTVTLRDMVVAENALIGLVLVEPDSRIEASDVTIRGTSADDAGEWGRGLEVNDGSYFHGERVLIEDNASFGVFSSTPDTVVELRDSVLRGNRGSGINVIDAAEVILRDSVLRDSLTDEVGDFGRGVTVEDGGLFTCRDSEIRGNIEVGVVVSGVGASADLQGCTIADTHFNPRAGNGRGIVAQGGGRVLGGGLLLEENDMMALWVGPGGEMRIDDSEIRRTRPVGDIYGEGLYVHGGGQFVGSGLRFIDNVDMGVTAEGVGTLVELSDSEIIGTRTARFTLSGLGMVAQDGAELNATGVRVAQGEGVGLYSVTDGVIRCVDCTIEEVTFAGGIANAFGRIELVDSTIRAVRRDPNRGGAVGLFGFDDAQGASSRILAENVHFEELSGPAVYLRGRGDYEFVDCSFDGSLTVAEAPGIVMALDGVRAWDGDGSGLLLRGNRFSDVSGVAVLLHGSSVATAANDFSEVGGLSIYQQDCGSTEDPVFLDGAVPVSSLCEGPNRDVEPKLFFSNRLTELDVLD